MKSTSPYPTQQRLCAPGEQRAQASEFRRTVLRRHIQNIALPIGAKIRGTHVSRETFIIEREVALKTSHRDVFKILLIEKGLQGESGLVRFQSKPSGNGFDRLHQRCSAPSKSCRFSHPFSPRRKSMRRGVSPSADGDKGLCPLTPPAFLKNCWIKKLHCRLRRGWNLTATPHKERLTALHVICLHLFRHISQKCS